MPESIRVVTDDATFLEGTISFPKIATRTGLLLLHGTGSNFRAAGALARFADDAVQAGYAVCRANNRGCDGIVPLAQIATIKLPLRGGAINEVISDCVYDIAAWVKFLGSRGLDRVILVGHSMGGVKAIYSQHHAPSSAVCGVICLSPPRLNHQHWMTHPRAAKFREHWQQANANVAASQPGSFLECTQPLPFLTTAAGFIEKYGPDDRYDYVPLLTQLTIPLLVIVGSQTLSASPAFDGLPEWVATAQAKGRDITLHVVTGASMSYSEAPSAPFGLSHDWLQTKSLS